MTATELDDFLVIGAKPHDPFYRYRWEGRDLPSWSTLRHVAGIKSQIHGWALDGMVTEAIRMGTTIAAAVSTNNPAAVEYVRTKLWEASIEECDRPARLGTKVHLAVETGVDPDHADADIAAKLRQYRHFINATGVEILGHEYQVYNLEVGYGGTVDLLALLPDGRIYVVDIKSGKNIWGEHALQVMGYMQGRFVGRDDVVDEAMTAFHRSAHGMAVLHLTDDYAEFVAMTPDQDTWAAFLGLHRFAVWQHAHDSIDDVAIAKRRFRA